jgi:hypothetical protein
MNFDSALFLLELFMHLIQGLEASYLRVLIIFLSHIAGFVCLRRARQSIELGSGWQRFV